MMSLVKWKNIFLSFFCIPFFPFGVWILDWVYNSMVWRSFKSNNNDKAHGHILWSNSSVVCGCVCMHEHSRVRLFATPWTIARQAPLSMALSRQGCWLLPLLSRFSRVRLCATPWTAAHQDPLSTGFSRQEYWSGLPFPSPVLRWVLVSHHLGEEKTLALGVENLRGLCKKKHIKLWLLGSVS